MSRMLTLKRVAETRGLHVNTVKKYVNQGMLRVMRVGWVMRLDKKDLERFIEDHKEVRGKTKR